MPENILETNVYGLIVKYYNIIFKHDPEYWYIFDENVQLFLKDKLKYNKSYNNKSVEKSIFIEETCVEWNNFELYATLNKKLWKNALNTWKTSLLTHFKVSSIF